MLAASSFLATAMASTRVNASRPAILGPDEAGSFYGAACGPFGGTNCYSPLDNECTANPSGQGTQCTTNTSCDPVDDMHCEVLDVQGTSYLCGTPGGDLNCSVTCSGGCYQYKYTMRDPDDGACPDGACSSTAECGFPKCAVTTSPP